jgi:hypothetical protein
MNISPETKTKTKKPSMNEEFNIGRKRETRKKKKEGRKGRRKGENSHQ